MDGSPPPASHDTGRPKSQASGLTDQLDEWETSECCPHTWDREIVMAQGAATGSAVPGTDKCPDIDLCKPKTPPFGAGDLIDGGRRLDLDQRIDQHLTVLDVRTSSLQTLCDRLPPPASTPTADLDNDSVQSPPPINLPRGLWGPPPRGPGHATVDWHGRSTDEPGQAEGQAGLAATAHSDALAPHKAEATEAEDAAQG